MAYIGNQGSVAGFVNQPSKQDLTNATGGTLTLTHAVSGPEDISLFINNVRQEPTTSYTANGTTVTLQGYTVAASDDIYVLYNGLTQLSSVPVDGSVSDAKISAMSASKLTGALPALDGSALTGVSTPVYITRFGLNSNLTSDGTLTDWAAPTLSNQISSIGTAVTVSSGVFTFPVTGVWKLQMNGRTLGDSDVTVAINLFVSTDGGSTFPTNYANGVNGGDATTTGNISFTDYINVDNTSNIKVKYTGSSIATGSFIFGATVANGLRCWVNFERITDAQ